MSGTTQIDLKVNDIEDAVKIIDYAAQEGAFKGWVNIRQILLVRDRLEAFVAAAKASQEVNSPAPVLDEAEAQAPKPKKRSVRT